MSRPHIAVVGGGPAGLRAAEIASAAGAQVTLYESKRSVGRKFLVAGKSGLNLTHDEDFESFLARYSGPDLPRDLLRRILTDCDSSALRAWASDLGIDTFAASSGKVFPQSMKAAPLLRAWVRRLRTQDVSIEVSHLLTDISSAPLSLSLNDKPASPQPDAIVLALGGASWPHTGSTGTWTALLRSRLDLTVHNLTPANCGWEVPWPAALLEDAEGHPLKNIALTTEGRTHQGEVVITRYGLEGGPLYHLGRFLLPQETPALTIDLKPSLSTGEVLQRLGRPNRNFVREAQRRLKLSDAAAALLRHLPQLGPWRDSEQLAAAIKACPLTLTGPRPVEEAISSAGGIAWEELDDKLMLKRAPGIFVAGEMIDWEAPTGGYLIQGCFATGQRAAQGALQWLNHQEA